MAENTLQVTENIYYLRVEGGSEPVMMQVITPEETKILNSIEKGDKGDSIIWKDTWTVGTAYAKNDTVFKSGNSYIARHSHIATDFDLQYLAGMWHLMAQRGDTSAIDSYYEHPQLFASSLWTIVHNLGKFPSVTVKDSGGTVIEGDVHYIDINTLTVSFSAPFGGTAYLN